MATYAPYPCEQYAVDRRTRDRTACAGWALFAAILGSGMPGIDATAVNVALPVLQRELHASADATQWVVEGYSLFLSALILAGGALGDRFGRRRMFVIGVAVFAIGSAGCALSQSVAQLIAWRCLSGFGGALLIPESLALITASFNKETRGKAIGTWSGFSAITMAIGPLLGGWFVQALSWRLIFVINIPIALVVVFATLRYVPESGGEERDPVDWIGASSATASLGLLVYGFIRLQTAPSDAIGLAAIGAGIVLMAAFIVVERTGRSPMVPMEVFASRDFAVANVYTLLLYAGLGASLFFIPFNLINVQRYTPSQAGAALLPMILIMFFSSRWSGSLVTWAGARIPLTAGAIVAACGFALFAFAGIGHGYWTSFFPASVVLGIGTSLFVAPLTTTVMNSISAAHAGSASGINNAVARVAGLLAIAVLGIVVVQSTHAALRSNSAGLSQGARAVLAADSLLSGHLPERGIHPAERNSARTALDDAYVIGFRNAMLTCAALSIGSALLAFALLGGRTGTRSRAAYT